MVKKQMYLTLFLVVLSLQLYTQTSPDCPRRPYFGIDNVLSFPKLVIKDEKLYPLLDSVLLFNKHFDFKTDSIDYYFQIDIHPPYSKIKGKPVGLDFVFDDVQNEDTMIIYLEVKQRNTRFGENDMNIWNMNEYKGGFCYKGYQFFIYSIKTELLTLNSLFEITSEKIEFYEYKKANYKKQKLPNGEIDINCENSEFGCYSTHYIDCYFLVDKNYIFISRKIIE